MGVEPRERALHELLSRDMVDIYVGPENTHWILHEKLLCHRSRFFRDVFYNRHRDAAHGRNHAYGLPDEDDAAFELFVGWLYSGRVPAAEDEKDLGPLLDLYLMGEKWAMPALRVAVLARVRNFYHASDSWPSLRRVQYVYAHTEGEGGEGEPPSAMRTLLVQCVARMLVVGEGMPAHWEKALRKNGRLAVDVILCVQGWRFEPESVPDARIEEPEVLVAAEGEENGVGELGRGAEDRPDEENGQLEWASGLSQSQTEAESEQTA